MIITYRVFSVFFQKTEWPKESKFLATGNCLFLLTSALFYPAEGMWVNYLYAFGIKVSVFCVFFYQRVRKSFNNTA